MKETIFGLDDTTVLVKYSITRIYYFGQDIIAVYTEELQLNKNI